MQDNNPSERFRNNMRLIIDSSRLGAQAVMQRKFYPNAQNGTWEEEWWQDVVNIKFLSDITCSIDWGRVRPDWGEKEFCLVMGHEGPKGLLEGERHFWRFEPLENQESGNPMR